MKYDKRLSSCSDRICFSASCELYHFTLDTGDVYDQRQSQNMSGSMGSGASKKENIFLSFVALYPCGGRTQQDITIALNFSSRWSARSPSQGMDSALGTYVGCL